METVSLYPDIEPTPPIPQKIGPWRHALYVIKEMPIDPQSLNWLVDTNQIAYEEPKWLQNSEIYFHKDWVDAVISKYPVAQYCLLQKHVWVKQFTEAEWKRRVPHRKPKELASEKQLEALRRVLKSDFILEGERRWILPIFDEKWIGYYRVKKLLEYFLGLKIKSHGLAWNQISEGVFELRRKSLALFHETSKKAELIDDDWF